MKNETHDLRVSARTARLTAGLDDEEDGDNPPWRFGGVAVAAGDILHMDDGTRVLMTAEELQKAAESQSQEPLTTDHPEDDQGRPQYPPPTDETVGKVPKAGWLEDAQGVGYEATTHDKEIADGVRGETYEVSVHPKFKLGEYREDVQAYVAEDIKFLDLSVVSKGDSPSNTADWGPNEALASYTEETDIGAELTASADPDGTLDDGTEGVISSTVRATLNAIGVGTGAGEAPDDWSPEDGSGYIPTEEGGSGSETAGAESPVDEDDSNTHMKDDTREQYVQFLTANAAFDEESVEAMDDDVLKETYELAAEGAGSEADGGSTDDDDDEPTDDKTLAEMTPAEAASELGDQLKQQGFVTEDNADELLAEAQDKLSKAEKVDEIIASSDEYDEDDREELMASADPLLEKEHERLTGQSGAQLQSGTASLSASAPEFGSDEETGDDPDEYGTGVAGN
jgi:hypothetical protein